MIESKVTRMLTADEIRALLVCRLNNLLFDRDDDIHLRVLGQSTALVVIFNGLRPPQLKGSAIVRTLLDTAGVPYARAPRRRVDPVTLRNPRIE